MIKLNDEYYIEIGEVKCFKHEEYVVLVRTTQCSWFINKDPISHHSRRNAFPKELCNKIKFIYGL